MQVLQLAHTVSEALDARGADDVPPPRRRRSAALEACRWLVRRGAVVRAYDPAVNALPADAPAIEVCASAAEATRTADAILVATPWPAFRDLRADDLAAWAKPSVVVLDPAGHLAEQLADDERIRYVTVGRAA